MNSLIELGFSQMIEKDLAKAIEYDIIFLFLRICNCLIPIHAKFIHSLRKKGIIR